MSRLFDNHDGTSRQRINAFGNHFGETLNPEQLERSVTIERPDVSKL
jgi:hypothetical protein